MSEAPIIDPPTFGSPFPEAKQDPWDEVQKGGAELVDAARANERARCVGLVRDAITTGLAKGVPPSSGVMRILEALSLAIANG